MSSPTFSRPFGYLPAFRLVFRVLFLAFLVTITVLPVLAQSNRDLRSYLDSIKRLQSQGDLAALEHFVATAPDGQLRNDALEWLAWREWRTGAAAEADHWADELVAGNAQNAVGLAILAARNTPVAASPQQSWADDPLLVAQRALRYLDSLRQPYGMPNSTFQQMKQDLAANLSGTVGDAYFNRKDYATAQPYLRQYLSLNPDDSARLYSLAITDLYGPTRDEAEGFRAFARVVNLSQSTAAGQQIAAFARNRYKELGGADADWDRYLQVTTAPGSAQIASSSQTEVAAAVLSPSGAPSGAARTPNTTARAANAPAIPVPKTSPPPRRSTPAVTDETSAADTSTADVPSSSENPDVPYPTRIPTATGPPMSLGIVIETSKTAAESRRAVINNLSDMVRHLRDDDEAFLVSFSNNVVFEEDLTSDPKSLERAMDSIKPQRGAALLDAIAFASGHLQRIGKNSRKILLVVSDGDDRSAQYSSGEALRSISSSRVEIFCIGMGSNNQADEARLKALARRTGGEAVFIGNARQFRTATREVASDMGIRLY
ncbi:MAG TPA: VWA domain-containing protein [Terriglobales bacterium]|nr:VWA domain-containing protein [Terriglobales bacterium]